MPTVSRALAKELFILILKILQIKNLETIKKYFPTSSFTKIDSTLIKLKACVLKLAFFMKFLFFHQMIALKKL